MVKVQLSYTLEDEAVALAIATTAYARYPRIFRMKTPEPTGEVRHVYLNPSKKCQEKSTK